MIVARVTGREGETLTVTAKVRFPGMAGFATFALQPTAGTSDLFSVQLPKALGDELEYYLEARGEQGQKGWAGSAEHRCRDPESE